MTEFGDEHVETGFDDPEITAAVTTPEERELVASEPEAEAKGLTEAGLDALKAMVALPADFGPPQMVALARDLAKNIHPLGTILTNHKLSNAQYEFLRDHNQFFQDALKQLSSEWQGIKSTAERLKHEALAALEEQLPVIASRMGKLSEKLIDTVEAAKLVAKIAGVDSGPAGGNASGERFTISIDLGADTRIVVGNESGAQQGSQAAAASAISAQPSGQGDAPKLLRLGQGQGDV